MKCKYCKNKKAILLECKYCKKGYCVSCIEIVKHECEKSHDCRKRKRDELEEEFEEGKLLTRVHKNRESSPSITKKKK